MTRAVGLAIVLMGVLCLSAIWQPHDPDAIDLANRFAGISATHPFGTDHLGRDLFSRLLVGGWRTAAVILTVAGIGLFCGSLAGTIAGVLGGWFEAVVLGAAQLFIIVPTLIVALSASAIFGLSPVSAGLALGLANLGPYALMANTLTRTTLGETHVHAARALGASERQLIRRHVLPATVPVLLAYAASQAGGSAVAYAALSFIGLGVDPSQPDWGSMLFEYRLFLFDHPGLLVWPALALAWTVSALNLAFEPPERV